MRVTLNTDPDWLAASAISSSLGGLHTHGRDMIMVSVSGELDVATAPELEAALDGADAWASVVVVDLRQLEFMASAGLRVLLDVGKRVRDAGGRLVILRGPPAVDRLFALVDDLPLELLPLPSTRRFAGAGAPRASAPLLSAGAV